MNFERSEILNPILDDLAANDQTHFSRNIAPPILTRLASQGLGVSSMAVELIFQGFRDELTKRGDAILSEMDNVLRGAYIEDFDKLPESLKAELIKRLESAVRLATSEFLSSTGSIRSRINHPNMPSATALSEHVEKLKPKWLAKVDLICENLRATQTPRLFLKRGEVFAGNRAARAIFESAKKSLDIIDTYFGPEVFDLLEVTQQSVKIRLISDKANNPTKQAYHLFNQQYGQRVDFRLCDPKDIHDRFIIVDGQSALHVGASIKDLGRSDSLIDSASLDPHKQRFEELWVKSSVVT